MRARVWAALLGSLCLRAPGLAAAQDLASEPSSGARPAEGAVAPGADGGGTAGQARAEVSVVAGNAASARKRALDEALYLSVDQALAGMLVELGLDPAAPPEALRGWRASLRAEARRYVRSYRVVSEGEVPGMPPRYQVTVEATVNQAALARDIARARGAPVAQAAGPAAGPWLLGAPELLASAAQALSAAGHAPAGQCAGCVELASWRARSGAPEGAAALLLAGQAGWAPPVLGADARSARCQGTATLARPGRAEVVLVAAELGFGDGDAEAAEDCWQRLARALVGLVLPALAEAPPRGGTIAMYVEATPAALDRLLQRLAGTAGLGRAEPRKLAPVPGHGERAVLVTGELRVTTTLSAPELARLLQRELQRDLALEVQAVETASLRLRVALPEDAPGGSVDVGPAAATAGGPPS